MTSYFRTWLLPSFVWMGKEQKSVERSGKCSEVGVRFNLSGCYNSFIFASTCCAKTKCAQQAWMIKVIQVCFQDIWCTSISILIKSNPSKPIFKKSYQPQFFLYFQVTKTNFLYEISGRLNNIFLIQYYYLYFTQTEIFKIFSLLDSFYGLFLYISEGAGRIILNFVPLGWFWS